MALRRVEMSFGKKYTRTKSIVDLMYNKDMPFSEAVEDEIKHIIECNKYTPAKAAELIMEIVLAIRYEW